MSVMGRKRERIEGEISENHKSINRESPEQHIIPVFTRSLEVNFPASCVERSEPTSIPRGGIKLYVPNDSGVKPRSEIPIKGAFEAKI